MSFANFFIYYKSMNLTEEQKQIVEWKTDLVVEARAGTGKTTTLIEFSKNNPKERKLYLAFNRTIADEAKEKFSKEKVKNIDVFTAHGLAFKEIVQVRKYKLGFNYTPYSLLKIFRLDSNSENQKIITHVLKKFESFCNSADEDLSKFDYESSISTDRGRHFYKTFREPIDKYCKKFWESMKNKSIECTHSWYLKFYQLEKPKLPYGIIMLDECQDANPVILDIFNNQTSARKIAVGDNHQAIYGWRGAINAIDSFPYEKKYLTESFRFPQSIADSALQVLSYKENYDPDFDFSNIKLLGKGLSNRPVKTKAVISRSNLSILKMLINNKNSFVNPYIEGGLDSITCTNSGVKFLDIYYLMNNRKEEIQNHHLKTFKTIKDYVAYCEDVDDNSVPGVVDFLENLKNPFPIELDNLTNRCVKNSQESDYTFSTIHKAKGKEWDEVEILESNYEPNFPVALPSTSKDGKNLTEEELNLLKKRYVEELNIYYVGVTRARVKLHHNISWLDEIQQEETNNEKPIDSEIKTEIVEEEKAQVLASFNSFVESLSKEQLQNLLFILNKKLEEKN